MASAFGLAEITPEQERLLALICGRAAGSLERLLMPSIAAYFDDSGTHQESRYGVVAGFIATPAEWLALTPKWKKLLEPHGLDWFHMTDCEAGRREYEHISEADRHKLIFNLGELIDEHCCGGFRSGLPKQVFDEVILREAKRNPEMKAFVKHAYAMGYRHVLHGLSLYCAETNTSPSDVEIVFAIQPKVGHAARDGARKQFTRAGFPEPSFREMRCFPSLQAADMLAWVTYCELSRGRDAIEMRHAPLITKGGGSYIDETILRWIGVRLKALHDAIEQRDRGEPE